MSALPCLFLLRTCRPSSLVTIGPVVFLSFLGTTFYVGSRPCFLRRSWDSDPTNEAFPGEPSQSTRDMSKIPPVQRSSGSRNDRGIELASTQTVLQRNSNMELPRAVMKEGADPTALAPIPPECGLDQSKRSMHDVLRAGPCNEANVQQVSQKEKLSSITSITSTIRYRAPFMALAWILSRSCGVLPTFHRVCAEFPASSNVWHMSGVSRACKNVPSWKPLPHAMGSWVE